MTNPGVTLFYPFFTEFLDKINEGSIIEIEHMFEKNERVRLSLRVIFSLYGGKNERRFL